MRWIGENAFKPRYTFGRARQRERGASRTTIAVGLGRRVGRRRGGGLARPVRAASRHARRGARSVPGGDDRHLRRVRVLGRIVVQGVGRPHAWHDADHDRRGVLRRPPRRAAVHRRGLARQRPNQRGDGRMVGMGDDRRHAGGAASRPRGVAAHSCAAAGLQRDVGWCAARLHRLASAAVPADVPPAHQPVDRRVDRAGHPCAGLHCDRRAALGHATDDRPRGRRLCCSGICDVADVEGGARVGCAECAVRRRDGWPQRQAARVLARGRDRASSTSSTCSSASSDRAAPTSGT